METPPPQQPGYGPLPPPEHSNYPRQMPFGYGPVPPRPPEVSLSSLRESWELMTQDLGTWVLASFVVILVALALSVPLTVVLNIVAYGSVWGAQTVEFSPRYFLITVLSGAVNMAVVTPFISGIYWMCLKRVRAEQYSLGDLFYGLRYFPSLAIVGFFTGILTYLGFLLCIIPGFFMMGVLIFAPLIAMDQKCGGLEAIRLSYQALRGHAFPMVGLMIVLGIILAVSAMLCVVPLLFTMPIYYFAITLHYHAFFPPQEHPGAVPVMPVAPQYSV